MAVAAEAEFANGALARLDWHPDAAPDSFDAPAVVGLGDGSSRRTDPDEPDGDPRGRIREACLETL